MITDDSKTLYQKLHNIIETETSNKKTEEDYLNDISQIVKYIKSLSDYDMTHKQVTELMENKKLDISFPCHDTFNLKSVWVECCIGPHHPTITVNYRFHVIPSYHVKLAYYTGRDYWYAKTE